jgi:hypothetical protein
MAPFVSVAMPIHGCVDKFAKLLLPVDSLVVFDDPRAEWVWVPIKEDAFDQITGRSFRQAAELVGCSAEYLGDGVWDLRDATIPPLEGLSILAC